MVLVACSSADPEIMQVDLRIEAVLAGRENGTIQEKLTVFLDVHDPDGAEDVAWIVAELPEYGVGWELRGGDLVHVERGEEHWFGAAGLVVPGMERIPRGAVVRITAGDLGGRTVEREIRIPVSIGTPEADEFPRIDDGTVFIPSPSALRHFIHVDDDIYEITGRGQTEPRDHAVTLGEAIPSELGDRPFTIIAEWGPYLWLETGPWELSGF